MATTHKQQFEVLNRRREALRELAAVAREMQFSLPHVANLPYVEAGDGSLSSPDVDLARRRETVQQFIARVTKRLDDAEHGDYLAEPLAELHERVGAAEQLEAVQECWHELEQLVDLATGPDSPLLAPA